MDCNGETKIKATGINELLPYVKYLKEKGICALLKSSCVNANVLNVENQSKYFENENAYCIRCGNCEKNH